MPYGSVHCVWPRAGLQVFLTESFCNCRQFTKELNWSIVHWIKEQSAVSFIRAFGGACTHVYCDCIVTTRYLSLQGLRDAHPIKPIIIIIN